ncbi:MAG: sulfatase/phosphatase domain-containing protein, partial [Akkermansiaceae bacterium]
RGGKGQMYEGGLRIPFMVQWKGHLPAGQLYRHPVSSMDLFATAAGLGNIPAPGNLDGVDLLPYLRGSKKDPPHESLFWRQRHKTAFRMGAWKIVGDTRKQDDHHWELYNLAQDLTERVNLASRHPDKLNELRQAWSAMNAQMAEPLF